MLIEHETAIELAGMDYPAIITYETDPEDGWPIIESVVIIRVVPGWDAAKEEPTKVRLTIDITRMLHEGQMSALEEEIDAANRADVAAERAAKRALEREEKWAA